MKKAITILLAAAMFGGTLCAGCKIRPRADGIRTGVSSAVISEAEAPQADAQGGRYVTADGGSENDTSTNSGAGSGRPATPLSTTPTKGEGGKINHGHAIPESRDRERDIRRTSDIILTEAEAYKLLTESITLQNEDLHFELTETSDNDPGAYMWYKFNVYRGDLKVINAEFFVLAFTDGAIVEGRADFTECAFYDTDGILSPKAALDKYREKNPKDTRKLVMVEKAYLYSGVYQERCPVIYVFRYSGGRLLIDAHTGDMIGHWKDQIN